MRYRLGNPNLVPLTVGDFNGLGEERLLECHTDVHSVAIV